MISRKNNQALRGYTFLEIALALGLIAIMFAAAVPVVTAGYRERRLQDGMDALGSAILQTREKAERIGVEHILVAGPDGLAIKENNEFVTVAQIPSGTKLSLRQPRGDWEQASGQQWRIFSSGLVSPFSLRLEDGSAWIETDYDFLTGNAAEERYSF